jgi:dynein heavy chain
MRKNLVALKEQEATLRRGLGIFKIDQPPSKDIAKLEQVCHHLTTIYLTLLNNVGDP